MVRHQWLEYDKEFVRHEIQKEREASKRISLLFVSSCEQLEDVALAQDSKLLLHMKKLASRRWELLLSNPHAIKSITKVQDRFLHKVVSPKELRLETFLGVLDDHSFLSPLVAKDIFRCFSAWQHIREGLIVKRFDVIDVREMIAACKLATAKCCSSIHRITGDLFSVYGDVLIKTDAVEAILTIGLSCPNKMNQIINRFQAGWKSVVSLEHRVRGCVSREDLRVILETFMKSTMMLDVNKKVLSHENRKEKLFFKPLLLSFWEANFLPNELREAIWRLRVAHAVEAKYIVSCKVSEKIRFCFYDWYQYKNIRRQVRRTMENAFLNLIQRHLKVSFARWMQFSIRDLAISTLYRFSLRALKMIRYRNRLIREENAIILQKLIRGKLTRNAVVQRQKQLKKCVTILQRFFQRQKLAYLTKLQQYRKMNSKWTEEKDMSCIIIQKHFRGYSARIRYYNQIHSRVIEEVMLRNQRTHLARRLAMKDNENPDLKYRLR